MKFLDPNHPFFRPVWVRWLTVLAPTAWGAMELFLGNPGWATIFGAAGVFAFYELIIKGPDQPS